MGHVVLAFAENQRWEIRTTPHAPQLVTAGGKPGRGYSAVAYSITPDTGQGATLGAVEVDTATAVTATEANTIDRGVRVPTPLGVRRLTPRECERLQGWPDDHTRWTADGREVADTHRYRLIGNGVMTPMGEWVARRVGAVL